MEKQELLNELSLLPLSTLDKLYKYSKYIIIPDEDLVSDVTMIQMVEKAHLLADSLFPEWQDRSKSDFGEFLVELMALFAEKNFWYINAHGNEGNLLKTKRYSNAFTKSSTFGYSPKIYTGSSAEFSVTFEAGQANFLYRRGTLKVSVGGNIFVNDSDFTVVQSSETAQTITLKEGEIQSEEYTFNGYQVVMFNKNISVDSLAVVVNDVVWSRVGNFGESSAESTHYIVIPEEDGRATVFFGNGEFGAYPTIGTPIQITYRTCVGDVANTDIQSCSVSESNDGRKATGVVMLSSATGGSTAESLNSIKQKAPTYFRSKRTCYNEVACEANILENSFVKKTKVVIEGRDLTYVAISSSGQLQLSALEIAEIESNLTPKILLGYYPQVLGTVYIPLVSSSFPSRSHLTLEVIIFSGYNQNTVRSQIIEVLKDVTGPLRNAQYGAGFSPSYMETQLRALVQGTRSVNFLVRENGVDVQMTDLSIQEREIFSIINESDVTINIDVV
jgi:hypothetical protein